ncbi:MAG: hypothetical protein GYB65_17095 [Chloroflexi bacterium]|nr:hypothetical protein [Chloroflexota bacterium]
MIDDILRFSMQRHDSENGTYYVINGLEIPLVTDGETIKKALHNLEEAVAAYCDDNALASSPRLEVSFEVDDSGTLEPLAVKS